MKAEPFCFEALSRQPCFTLKSRRPRQARPSQSPGDVPVQRSGVLLFEAMMLEDVETRIDQFATEQRERRLVVEFEVVEGVGQDLRHPDEAGLDIADEEEMHGAEQKPADADRQP